MLMWEKIIFLFLSVLPPDQKAEGSGMLMERNGIQTVEFISIVLVTIKYIGVQKLQNANCAISMIPHMNKMLLCWHLKLALHNANMKS